MPYPISIAPMMDYTDRHFRYLMRIISSKVLLYTEMITSFALLHGNKHKLLQFDLFEKPVALQLGGCSPSDLALCAKMAEEFGYDEINLNIGCPSDRVQSGRFGACLMKEPIIVRDCISAMKNQSQLPITVKCRIGVDQESGLDFLANFVGIVIESGCDTFIIHARKAWLKGLSPKENREIPLLQYDIVYQLKQIFPQLNIIINGGIQAFNEIEEHLKFVDGCMIGRKAWQDPFYFADIENCFSENSNNKTREDVFRDYLAYFYQAQKNGARATQLLKPVLNLFHGVPGAKDWRRGLTHYLAGNTHISLESLIS